jgi:hypothetical protein
MFPEDVLPRFLNAVSTMARSSGTLAARVSSVVEQLIVFRAQDFPGELEAKYDELLTILENPKAPQGMDNHPSKMNPAAWLSPSKAQRAADLILELFEAAVWSRETSPEGQ